MVMTITCANSQGQVGSKDKVEMDGRMDMIDCTAFPTKMVSNEKRAGGVIDYL